MEDNLKTYNNSDVVGYYTKYESLQKPEQTILNKLKSELPQLTMLDIGVGGGRTTMHFAPLVRNYIGVDYAIEMVNACKNKFQNKYNNAQFDQADVRDLGQFNDSQFDFVLFSFNGIDTLEPEDREIAFAKMHQVLKKGGYLCFSSHNIKSLKGLGKIKFRKNIVAMISRYFDERKILQINQTQLSNYNNASIIRINDGAHNFTLINSYVKSQWQIEQLKSFGFKDVQIYKLSDGMEIPASEAEFSEEKWFYYLARKV